VFPFAGIVTGYPNIFQDNFLLCDGALVDRVQFSGLYTAIGDYYGAGDGINTFNVPDMRGRTVLGFQQAGQTPMNPTVVSDPDAQTLGGKGGEDLHTLTIDQLPAHQHEFWAANDFNSKDDGKDRSWGFNRGARRRFTGDQSSNNTGLFDPSDVAAAIAADWRNPNPTARSGGQPHPNLQPYIVVNYIIKV
jgi:microcystin-dependent protein